MAVKLLLFLAFLIQVSCEKHGVTLVIDDTFSLVDDIKQVKNASQLILDKVLEKSEIENYVLVTLNNPDTELKKKTGDPKELTKALDTIKVHGGNKARCSEIVLTGIKRALSESQDGSYLFVFTDASARDYDQFEEVKALCQKKKSQIYLIVSGHCGDISTRRYQVYLNLAAACKGQAITIHKDDVAQVPAYLKKIIKGDREVIESGVFPANRWRNIKFSIDDLTDNYMISASGINVDLKLANTRNWPVHIDDTTKIAWTRNFKAFEPSKLKDGVYTLKVRSESPVEVTIMARTNFTFEYGFSVRNVTSLNATDPHPFTDIKTRLVIFAKDPESSVEVRGVELHSGTGKVSKPLTTVKDNIYTTEEFLSTKEPFRIAVKAIAKKTKKVVKSFAKKLVVPIQPGSVDRIKVKEGASIDIRCRTSSNRTNSQITWYERQKDGYFSVLSGQTKEILHVKKPADKAYYKCVARNATGFDQYNGQLDISVKPEFIYPPSVILVNIGDPVRIECKLFKGNPWPDLTWHFKHDNATTYEPMAQQGDTLKIASAEFEHSGEYRCLANNAQGTDEKITKVLVQVAPEILKTDNHFTIKEGVPIDLTCSILKGLPKPVITWYSKQEKATDFEQIVDETNEILHLINATISKSYKCEANNSAGSDFHIVKIDVKARPEFKVTTPNITVNEGDPVTIDCKLRKGSPPLERSWEKRLNSMASFKTLRHEGEELNILAVEPSQAGEYKCVAENPEGRAEKITELIVRVVPMIENVAPTKTAVESSNIALQCRITKGFPKPTVKWFYKSPEMTEFLFMSKTGEVLLLEHIKMSYTGHYKCVAKNEVGQAEQIVQLVVNGPPKIVFIPPNTSKHSAVEGDSTLRLPCTAAGYPAPNITWLVDGKIVGLDKCQLPKQAGPCRAGHTRWYYDKTLNECRQFIYGGCQGNDNRFESVAACRSECGAPITESVTIRTPEICKQPVEVGPCQAAVSMWYFDNTQKTCREFTYGGCNGNENRFQSEEECRGVCLPPPLDKCQLPKETGPCRAGHTRWYYDKTLEKCLQFTYGGCQGNDNRFESEAVCRHECGASVTEPGKYEKNYVEGNVLIIKNPKEARSSKYHSYVCRATNEVGEDTRTYEVVITDHVEFTKGNETYGIYMQPYDIECPLSYTDPSFVKWYKNSKLIGDKTGPLLHFDAPTELDNGNYTCRVSGLTGSPSHTVQVIFGFPPTRDRKIYNVEWGENQKSLSCYSLEYPEGKYEWFYNGENIGWNKETINITNWGEYICNVKNPLGSLDIIFKVTTPDKGCRVPKSLFTSKHAPLVLDSSLSWPILQTFQEHFLVPHSDKLLLMCQDDSNSLSKNSFQTFPNLKSLYATCEEEDLFWVDGNIKKISEFKCIQNVMPGVRQTNITCLGENTELMQVGFLIDGFTEVYQSCMDLNKLVPLYTKMNTIPAEKTALRVIDDAATKESCEDESACCYEQIQLVNATDVSFGPAKSATTMYKWLNSVKYCKLRNDFDWYNIEMITRSEINYTVWTGASKYMEVDTEDETIDTPRYLWKVLRYYSGSDEEIIAIIHENVDRPGLRLCAGACGNKSTLFVPSGRRTYCCSLEDFKKALGVDIDLML